MYKFTLPNYKSNNIINLVSSISQNFNQPHSYSQLTNLNSKSLKKYKNIILLVIDGLGYNFLKSHKDSFLGNNLHSSLTSTFLSTTTCANIAFHVGYPAQQHALTGWDINLKEIGSIVSILPFTPAHSNESLSNSGLKVSQVLDIKSFHKNLNADCYSFADKIVFASPFAHHVTQYTEKIPTTNYKNLITKLKNLTLKPSRKRRFLHGYIHEFDKSSHIYGTNSEISKAVFLEIEKKIKFLVNSLKGTNTKLIITADHGFIDTTPSDRIYVKDINGLDECLTIPLTGEPRVRYCHVKPAKIKDFKRIIKTKLSKYCWCFSSEQLINDHFYGLGKPHKKLFDRVGDFVLIMKNNYVLNQFFVNENNQKPIIGNHGGVSDNEMLVPLITFNL
jgi:hypothetical protein